MYFTKFIVSNQKEKQCGRGSYLLRKPMYLVAEVYESNFVFFDFLENDDFFL